MTAQISEFNAATLRLFKALPVNATHNAEFDKAIALETLPHGFIFAPEVTATYGPGSGSTEYVKLLYGRNSQELNAAFHKSFAKVRDASLTQLYVEQIAHYMTTYGAERLGIYNEDHVFVPFEQLDAPELDGDVRLVVIRGMTKAELKFSLGAFLASGVALSEQTVKDSLLIAQYVGFDERDLSLVKNREVQIALYDELSKVPSQPEDFLRFLIYKATGKTLVIKNPGTIAAIKANDNTALARYFDMYDRAYGLDRLGEVFYRYKPLFLAFRTNVSLKKYVNRIRRLAVNNHKPMREDGLNTVTARIKGATLTANSLRKSLEGASTFRKARLAYALRFRAGESDSVVYRVRNGKSWATEFEPLSASGRAISEDALRIVVESIVTDLRPKVEGKSIFIPAGLHYGLPATEKQFTGNVPNGTSVQVTDDMVVGVHWENLSKFNRVDLDLSLTSADGKIGWDGGYRDKRNKIYFSGDVTDAPAPNGASEVFHIGAEAEGSWLVNLNYYNYDAEYPVPFKIVVAQDDRANVNENYVIDPNKVVALSSSVIDVHQKTLGMVVSDKESTRFFFSESAFQVGRSAGNGVAAEQARKFLVSNFADPIVLNDALKAAGAVFVDNPNDADLDLSLEAVDKSTFINLLA